MHFISSSPVVGLLMMERLVMRRIDPTFNGLYAKDIVCGAVFVDVKRAERCCHPKSFSWREGVGAKLPGRHSAPTFCYDHQPIDAKILTFGVRGEKTEKDI
jgi:hypothetical protein